MSLKSKVTVIFCLITCFVYSQSSEAEKLLNQAQEIVSYNPVEAGTITEHTLKNATDDQVKIRSLYIGALSSYILGDYDLALTKAFEGKELADESNNSEFKFKIRELIGRIFGFLQLKGADVVNDDSGKSKESIFETEHLIEKGNKSLFNSVIDSAQMFAAEAKKNWSESNPGYQAALYYGLVADIDFEQKNFESSMQNYKKAIQISDELKNPFLNEVLYDKIAANFLVLGNPQEFQKYSELSKSFNLASSKIETKASNEAHKLRIKELDRRYSKQTATYRSIMWILFSLAMVALALKIIFYIRNRNRLKMFGRLLNYLKSQEELKEVRKTKPAEETVIEPEYEAVAETVEKEAETNSHPKTSSLLKESEEQILAALEKFESSKRYNHKDMSLSKLATQLNTNTKYLSEVINRNKGKNFNAYINKLRIDYITEKMKEDTAYLNYKVSYLAEECGYSSHSTFTTVFKSIVGVSPIMFVDFIREESHQEHISN